MIAINAPIFDIDGRLVIRNPEPEGLGGISRRVSRVATLNGEASISDFGFTDADRTISVRWRASRGEYDLAQRLVKTYSRLIVSLDSGCYLCAPSEFAPDNDLHVMTLLVEKRLSA